MKVIWKDAFQFEMAFQFDMEERAIIIGAVRAQFERGDTSEKLTRMLHTMEEMDRALAAMAEVKATEPPAAFSISHEEYNISVGAPWDDSPCRALMCGNAGEFAVLIRNDHDVTVQSWPSLCPKHVVVLSMTVLTEGPQGTIPGNPEIMVGR